MSEKSNSMVPQGAVLLFKNKNGKRIAVPLGVSNVAHIEEQNTAKRKVVERNYCSIFLNNPSHINNCKHVNHTLDEVREAWEYATGVRWTEVQQDFTATPEPEGEANA